ncbi:hypothetical protein T265_07115 [Opisthorchis viverrini]|uniref:Uncharacterized protein n=1 Tax=Opisthorchis viverrini TaxID=6198 RepID=A0A074ZE33_OPIVI|nr:hypothetical protein T265_07115 [Opisthorchis viverrini]KER25433.1 hypothetical protein T265_07115 [Opisthorchis viverrini]
MQDFVFHQKLPSSPTAGWNIYADLVPLKTKDIKCRLINKRGSRFIYRNVADESDGSMRIRFDEANYQPQSGYMPSGYAGVQIKTEPIDLGAEGSIKEEDIKSEDEIPSTNRYDKQLKSTFFLTPANPFSGGSYSDDDIKEEIKSEVGDSESETETPTELIDPYTRELYKCYETLSSGKAVCSNLDSQVVHEFSMTQIDTAQDIK